MLVVDDSVGGGGVYVSVGDEAVGDDAACISDDSVTGVVDVDDDEVHVGDDVDGVGVSDVGVGDAG